MILHDNSTLFWLENDLLSFAISALLAGIIIPKILLIAFRKTSSTRSMSGKCIAALCPVLEA